MKKNTIIALTIIGVLLVATIGATFAYFASSNQNDGNDASLNQTTEELGSILLDGTKAFTSYDLLPGQIGIQEFTIEKDSESGRGIYELDLAATVPEEFRSDIEILLYKTTEPDTNNVTVNVADPTLENNQIYQEDSLSITGNPELVYQGVLTENPQIILEQADFDVATLEKTTYYLVYHYKNNGNQDDQQGKTFTGTISVRLISEKMPTAVETILALGNNSNELVYDRTSDNNLRYIGADPNNYVSFNGEGWRIIGVFNNVDDGNGNKASRLKLIRSDFLTTSYFSVIDQYLMNYYESDTFESKNYISNVNWSTASVNNVASMTTTMYYETEHLNDQLSTSPIGVIYPSDYGYATSGGNNTVRDECLSVPLYYWNDSNYVSSDCYTNNWLNNMGWTMLEGQSFYYRLAVDSNRVTSYMSMASLDVYPVVYLKNNIKITGGDGSEESPFTLSVE